MIILGLKNCPGCKTLRDRHPNIPYVEVSTLSAGDREMLEIKKKMLSIGIDRFPALVNDEITEEYPVSSIDEEF
jgi:electron transfer flavoprotein alpha/beta subunit